METVSELQQQRHWYSANHVSRYHWHLSQSLTEFVNCLHFTGLTVRGSLNECWNIRSQDLFLGTFVPMMELSFSGPLIPCNIRSLDRSFPGTFVPGSSRYPGPFLPGSRGPFIHLSAEQYLSTYQWCSLSMSCCSVIQSTCPDLSVKDTVIGKQAGLGNAVGNVVDI